MQNYDPRLKDLSSKNLLSRAIVTEINSGRGCGQLKDHVYLQLHHLPKDVLKNKLSNLGIIARNFAGVDISKESIPIVPTVHYNMGGIPTNR